MKHTKVSNKRQKFNLDDMDSDEDNMFMGFTHGGRKLEELDDFKDEIPMSSDDEDKYNIDRQKGQLDEQMVERMNFGGGVLDNKDQKKSRKEVFEEIIAKSKTYKMAHQEIKMAAKELQHRLDDEYQDLLPLLNLSKNKEDRRELPETKLDRSYEKIASTLATQQRVMPTQVLMTEQEQAKLKKKRLEALAEEGEEDDKPRKRDTKLLDKREHAIDRYQKDTLKKYKNDIKASIVED